jgi:hypothetical protein
MKTITELARMWKNKEISTSSLKKELKEVELFTPIKFDDSEPSVYSKGNGTSMLEVEFFVFPEEPELFQQFEAIVIETLQAS